MSCSVAIRREVERMSAGLTVVVALGTCEEKPSVLYASHEISRRARCWRIIAAESFFRVVLHATTRHRERKFDWWERRKKLRAKPPPHVHGNSAHAPERATPPRHTDTDTMRGPPERNFRIIIARMTRRQNAAPSQKCAWT